MLYTFHGPLVMMNSITSNIFITMMEKNKVKKWPPSPSSSCPSSSRENDEKGQDDEGKEEMNEEKEEEVKLKERRRKRRKRWSIILTVSPLLSYAATRRDKGISDVDKFMTRVRTIELSLIGAFIERGFQNLKIMWTVNKRALFSFFFFFFFFDNF